VLPHLPTRWQFDVLVCSAKRCLLAIAVAGGRIDRDEGVAILAEISLHAPWQPPGGGKKLTQE
jgi:hypothetical protein